MGDQKLPDTKPYRVVLAGASYLEPKEVVGLDGDVVVQHVYQLGLFGQEVQLTDREARRLEELGAVKPADAPLGYEEQSEAQLEQVVAGRGLTVRGTGADGALLKEDLVNALNTFDAGQGYAQPVQGASAPLSDQAALEARIRDGKLNVDDTVALAEGQLGRAELVLQAETAANDGEPRKGVVEGLGKLTGSGEAPPTPDELAAS